MEIITAIAFIFTLVGIIVCITWATTRNSEGKEFLKKGMQIQKGMSKNEVMQIMSMTSYSSESNNNSEIVMWKIGKIRYNSATYASGGGFSASSGVVQNGVKSIKVTFVDEKVTAISISGMTD